MHNENFFVTLFGLVCNFISIVFTLAGFIITFVFLLLGSAMGALVLLAVGGVLVLMGSILLAMF
jgi:hypothetical protein